MSYYVEDISNCTNISNYDLLCSIIEEIEQTSSSLQIFQVQVIFKFLCYLNGVKILILNK